MSPSKFHLWKLTCFLITVATEVLGSESFQRYKSIISFGDSISDTGNFLHLSDPNHLPRWPPHYRLHCMNNQDSTSVQKKKKKKKNQDPISQLNLTAEFLGIPYISPYFGHNNQSFENGINFAVAGATAVEPELLQEKGITANYMTNVSLIVQLSIFKKILPNLCGFPSDCREILENSLFIVGEIGELNLASMNNMVQELFNLGARTFLVPGKFPTGCSAAYLTRFRTTDMIYGETFTVDKPCGSRGVKHCRVPSEYVTWDGFHLTEAAYRWIAKSLLNGPLASIALAAPAFSFLS
ncbi:F1K23.15 [Arabidopsis thaliana]|uniref:F1K23.15 n=1 Tax=Arabidopsis thaliana TaxID=3702 RepID=Q9SHP7_ARATH|nr:F1K23.15 [Arabidopsis thaliana]